MSYFCVSIFVYLLVFATLSCEESSMYGFSYVMKGNHSCLPLKLLDYKRNGQNSKGNNQIAS